MRASEWREVKSFYTSPGFAEEEVTVFFATGLERVEPKPDEGERPGDRRVAAGRDRRRRSTPARDAKSLVGLLLFRRALGD